MVIEPRRTEGRRRLTLNHRNVKSTARIINYKLCIINYLFGNALVIVGAREARSEAKRRNEGESRNTEKHGDAKRRNAQIKILHKFNKNLIIF